MAIHDIPRRAIRIQNRTDAPLRVRNRPGQTIREFWINFISKETPRLKNWDKQQISAFDSAHFDSELIK